MQLHSATPDGSFGQSGAAVTGVCIAKDDALARELRNLRRKVHLRVVSGNVILAQAVHHKNEDVRPWSGGANQRPRQVDFNRLQTSRGDVGVLLQVFKEPGMAFVFNYSRRYVAQ